MTQHRSALIRKLNRLQISDSHNFYYQPGLWSSTRSSKLFHFTIEDNNIFISASIVNILRCIYSEQSKPDQKLIDKMIERFLPRIDEYRNKDGKSSFNFWRTQPSEHFPHGSICQHLDYFRLPDDADDSSMIYLSDPNRQVKLLEFQQLLAEHANTIKKSIKKMDKRLKNFKAYTTFFAVNMPNEFDICAQTNILMALYKYRLEFDEFGIETIKFIKRCIELDLIRTNSFQLSPNYARASLIYYHILRMIHYSKTNDFNDIYNLIKKQLNSLTSIDSFDELLIGLCRKFINEPSNDLDYRISDFSPFFIAGMLSAFDNPLAQLIAPWQFTHIHYQSEALNTALLLQYHSL